MSGAGSSDARTDARKAGRDAVPGRPGPKLVTGIVTSDKMQKTRSVEVTRLEEHPKYGKFLRRRTTFKVHDEKEESREGDTVLIVETRPLSKTKRWRLIKVVARSAGGHAVVVPGSEDSALQAKDEATPAGEGDAS
jgi:small subunit ribosomal protein S17